LNGIDCATNTRPRKDIASVSHYSAAGTSNARELRPMAKKKSAKNRDAQLPLEEAMSELQAIVASLESGQEPLDESLAQFERGMQLLRTCHQKLEHAAQRIEIVTRVDQDGNFHTAEFDAGATIDRDTD